MELFAPHLTETEAAAWLDAVFNDLRKQPDVPVATYHGSHDGRTVAVQITERVQGGDYTSVWFSGDTVPWDGPAACARSAHDATGKPMLYYQESADDPWTMIRVSDRGKERVDARELVF